MTIGRILMVISNTLGNMMLTLIEAKLRGMNTMGLVKIQALVTHEFGETNDEATALPDILLDY